jgi:hypothetical protein
MKVTVGITSSAISRRWLRSRISLLDPTKKGAEHPAGLVLVVVVKHELIYVVR